MPFSIYLIQHKTTGTTYVGQSCKPARRFASHRYAARKGRTHLERAMRKHGPEAFSFQVIETWQTQAEALEAECFLIAYLRGLGADLYNLTDGGEQGPNGIVFSPESRAKMSAAKKGKSTGPKSAEHKAKIGQSVRALERHHSAEHKQHLSQEFTGEGNPFAGQHHSDETRARISAAKKAYWAAKKSNVQKDQLQKAPEEGSSAPGLCSIPLRASRLQAVRYHQAHPAR